MGNLIKQLERNQRGRDLIIGDIHGYFSKAMAALLAVGFDPMFDRVFSVGDLVDRGPESIDVLDWLDKPWFHAVRGNHEQMAIEEVESYFHSANRMVIASQPTRPTGFFYNTHHKLSRAMGGVWNAMVFNSEDSPLVSDGFLLEKLAEYGGSREDPQYQIKVRGMFPANLEGQLLGRGTLQEAIGQAFQHAAGEDYGWLVLVDVGAGEWRDKSVVVVAKLSGSGQHHEETPRRVDFMRVPIHSNTIKPTALVAEVMNIAGALSNATILVDAGALGRGVFQWLEELGVPNVVKVLWGDTCLNGPEERLPEPARARDGLDCAGRQGRPCHDRARLLRRLEVRGRHARPGQQHPVPLQ